MVHLDPDLNPDMYARKNGWRPLFGQSGNAQGHLIKKEVKENDLFLFFGWFREVVLNTSGRYKYREGAPDLHVIFGWLQVEKKWKLQENTPDNKPEEWAEYHSHSVVSG